MKKILIVEDEFRIRSGLSHLIDRLAMGGRVIGEAEDGKEGLRMIQELEPDIVITDIEMPHMNGLSMIEIARKMQYDGIFVILTGYAEFSYAQKAVSLGVSEYLLKPTTISGVKELLRKLIPEETMREEEERQEDISPIIRRMTEDIGRNYNKRLSLDSFAEDYHMTPQYLSNLFTKEIGKTFSDYVRTIRMEKAKELLINTDMKIYAIACFVGYPDQKYFSKVFREYTGVSAKQFAMENGRKRE